MAALDVFDHGSWKIPTAIAWVMWRDPEKVREFSNESTKLSFAVASNFFDPDDPENNNRPYLSFDQAFNEIQTEAAYRGLPATAQNARTGEFGRISEAIWPELESNFTERLVSLYVHKIVRAFDDVRFERAEIMCRWPELKPGKESLPDGKVSISKAINCLAVNGKDLAGYQIDDTRLHKEACALLVDMLLNKECFATGVDQASGVDGDIDDDVWRSIARDGEEYKVFHRFEANSEGDADTLTHPSDSEPRWIDICVEFGGAQSDKAARGEGKKKSRKNPLVAAQRVWIKQELLDRSKWGDGQTYDGERSLARAVSNRIEELTGEKVHVSTCRNHVSEISKELGLKD